MHRVGLVLFPGVQVLSLAPLSVFEMANGEIGRAFYDVTVLSESGGQIGTSIGAVVDTQRFGRQRFDTVMFGGATTITQSSPKLLDFVRKSARSARRIAGPCTGAFVLADAGILDGRRATTHWHFAREFRSMYPRVTLEEDRIFIIDGPVWTSAGMTASLDLALAMVEKDLGLDIARNVARKMVLFHRRAGGQSQFSALLELDPKSDRIQSALAYARSNLRTLHSVDQLADAVHLSPRQFSRAFRAETGRSPAKAIETLRLEAARLMMEEGRHPIEVVARETGFANRERMRRAFLRAYGVPPQALRRQIGVAA
ncbi:GlxA family transcriptional regulator [Steroidobacter sp.]|uniref:GlxA family transcriptional regulator n=1 Tax=Steroidobacter sp. TaxID=1978227 RepID=UPI0032C24963